MRVVLLVLALLAGCTGERKAPPRDAAPAPAPAPARSTPRAALDRAAAWLAAFPADELRYDAAVGVSAIRRRIDDPTWRAAHERALSAADRDPDNPMRRAFDSGYLAPKRSVLGWTAPAKGAERINPNRVVIEALHCDVHGLRPETLAYATGPMRDDGGYHTTHAVWALVIARDRGCVDAALLPPLLDELRAAQPAAPGGATLEVDLFAERILMLLLAGDRDVAPWIDALVDAQASDGGFGVPTTDEAPYLRYHATMLAAWALAAWLAPDVLDQLRDAGYPAAAEILAARVRQRTPKMKLTERQAIDVAWRMIQLYAALDWIEALHEVMPRSTIELVRAVEERGVPLDDALAIARYLVKVVAALDFERLATFDENHSHVTGRRWSEIDYSGEGMTWEGQRDDWTPKGVPDFRSATAIDAYFRGAEKLPHWRKVYRPRGTMADVTP